jgi:hypothetical protein
MEAATPMKISKGSILGVGTILSSWKMRFATIIGSHLKVELEDQAQIRCKIRKSMG